MKSVSFLRNTWKKKENKPAAIVEDASTPRQSSHTLPRSAIHSSEIRDILNSGIDGVEFPAFPRSGDVGGHDSSVIMEQSDISKARRRSRSMGAQYASQDIASRPFPSADAVPDLPPLPATLVTRPPRKSSLVPISSLTRTTAPDIPPRTTLLREASASSLRIPQNRTLRAKRSMPELDRVWEGFLEEADEVVTPTRREFKIPRELEASPSRRRLRSGSNASYASNQRYSNLPDSPAPSMALPSIPTASKTRPILDLASPRKSNFRPEITTPSSRPSTASSLVYLKDSTSQAPISPHATEHLAYISRYTPPLEDLRSASPGSVDSEVTLSMFPQPPPLNIRHLASRSPTPSQYPPTPEYSPTATPTRATFFHTSQFSHTRKTSPPASILKKPSGYFSPLPSPPITPSTPSLFSTHSNNSFSTKMLSSEALHPTLRIRNSSPHISSAKAHAVHRPTSSDSSSDKSAYSVSPDRMDRTLRTRALSRPEAPVFLETYVSDTYVPDTPYNTRPPSPETDSEADAPAVQWGYAV